MSNYPGEYFQLRWGVLSITLGSMFNYTGEYFQLPWGVSSTTLGNMFDYLVPWGVLSTTLGSIFNYPGEYVQLPSNYCICTFFVDLLSSGSALGGLAPIYCITFRSCWLLTAAVFFHDLEVPSGSPRRNFPGPPSSIWIFLGRRFFSHAPFLSTGGADLRTFGIFVSRNN